MKHWHRLLYPSAWSTAAKITIALLSVALVPMGVTAFDNLQRSLERLESSEYRKLELLATSTSSRLDQMMVNIQRVVVQVSNDSSVVDFFSASTPEQYRVFQASVQQTLQNVFRSNPNFDAVFVLNAQGVCVASTDAEFIGQNYAFREYFREAMQGLPYISSILIGQTTGRPGMFFSHPVRSPDGKIVGVTVLKIRSEDIWAIVNSLRAGSRSYAFLIDQKGVIISHPDRSLLYQSLLPLSPEQLQQIAVDRRYGENQISSLNLSELTGMIRATSAGHASYHSPFTQTAQIVGFSPLNIQPWVLGVSQPKPEFAAPLNYLIWQNSLSVLMMGAVTTVIALLLARGISKPIRSLTAAAQALEQNRFDPKSLASVSHTQDDMGQLVRVFLKMAEEVSAREQRLKQQVLALQIEIDETKRDSQVAEITENEHFEQLLQKIQKLRSQSAISDKARTHETKSFH
jgi:C4-dicarboxylate-specific signal transduction histidine kinase